MTDCKARINGGGLRETKDGKYSFFEIELETSEQGNPYHNKRVTWSRGTASDKSVAAIFKTIDALGADIATINTIEDCCNYIHSNIGREVIAAKIEEKPSGGKVYLQAGFINTLEQNAANSAAKYTSKASDELNARFAAAKASVLSGALPGQLTLGSVDGEADEEIPF